jgi:hypothetical protein
VDTKAELFTELNKRKDRCKKALEDPHLSDRIKQRVLSPEYQIYLLAVEGFAALEQRKEKHGLLSMRPATIVAPQTD